MPDVTCDVLVVGASFGGVAAALRAAASGAEVCLVEATDWVGGQLTSQGVCTPDEHPWIESGGATWLYRKLRHDIRVHYLGFPLSAQGIANRSRFNPGKNWVSRVSVEARVGERLLREALAAFSNITLILNAELLSAEMDGDRIASLTFRVAGEPTRYLGKQVIDATDLGDVLPVVGAEYRIGAESNLETDEPRAPDQTQPNWIQPLTFVAALERHPKGSNFTITPPPDYETLRQEQQYSLADGAISKFFWEHSGLWTYRRIIAHSYFRQPPVPFEISTINTRSNDYQGGSLPTGSPSEDAELLARARQATLGYIYWLQTECPRDDGGYGYPELKPSTTFFDTSDGIAPAPYIRESRRIVALKTVREQDIAQHSLPGPRATFFEDSCGIGQYTMDGHGLTAPWFSIPTYPFQIPLGALVPVRITNLIAGCKNLGVTHLTNGAYRVHPIEWGIGEAAGALAALGAAESLAPREIAQDVERRRRYQRTLIDAGIPLFWWSDVPQEDPGFAATQLVAMRRYFGGYQDLRFQPKTPFTKTHQQLVTQRVGKPLAWPTGSLTRRDAAIWLARTLGL